jgi:hypothetical protein
MASQFIRTSLLPEMFASHQQSWPHLAIFLAIIINYKWDNQFLGI